MGRISNFFRRCQNMNPARVVVLSFGLNILVGTLLLLLPIASAGESHSLFTATSAACVIGMTLVDTLTGWSPFGQLVILLLMQVGAPGFVTVLTLLTFTLRRRAGLSDQLLLASSLNLNHMDGVIRLVTDALRVTFSAEGILALVLAIRFVPEYGVVCGLWNGIFSSVSAMCNAELDLFGSAGGSLMGYRDDPLVLAVVMLLNVFGGLGFFAWRDLFCAKGWKGLQMKNYAVIGLGRFGSAVATELAKLGNVVFPENEMGVKLAQSLTHSNVLNFIELSENYGIVEARTPASWVGKTIKELDVRGRYHVNIIAMRDDETDEINAAPDPHHMLKGTDVLLLLGEDKYTNAVHSL